MKKVIVLFGILALCTGLSFAQTEVILDDFETTCSGWVHTGGYTTYTWIDTDGANGTSKCIEFNDAGWSKGMQKVYTAVVPEDGDYKVTFYYKNGDQAGKNPWPGLGVRLNGGNAVDLGSSQVSTWTAAETGVATGLTAGSDVTVEVYGTSSSQADNECRFDEFKLVKVTVVPITVTVRPLSGYYVAGTQEITVEATGGSGTFTQATFDIDNDGNIEYTDNTPGDGFSYSWDTTTHSDGSVEVKVVVTDDASNTGEQVVTYTVDNTNGREDLVLNPCFESWDGTYPDNWVYRDLDADGNTNTNPSNVTVSKDTTDPAEGNNCLKITFAATDYTYRYTMFSNAFAGDRTDYIVWFWGKGGGDCRVCYFYSDDGSAWVSDWHIVSSDSAETTWNEKMETPPWTPTDPHTYRAIATHKYSAGDDYWDCIRVSASGPGASVNDWDLY